MLRFFVLVCLLLSAPSFAVTGSSAADRLKGVPLDKAIKIGSGPRGVIEISDPDCYFSRRMTKYWNLRKDVTRYIFLTVKNKDQEASQKARHVLTASDRVRAYQEVFAGALDFDEKLLEHRYDDRGLLELHRQVADRLSVKVTPTYFINGAMIEGARLDDIEQALGGEKVPFAVEEADGK